MAHRGRLHCGLQGSLGAPVTLIGVRVIMTGAAVANGADWWLPCYVRGRVPDPATGASKPWAAKGWIHSAFLEEDG